MTFVLTAVEFGVWSALGESYPTTGFSAAYTLAHELGHSMGMRHDGFPNNDCQANQPFFKPRAGEESQSAGYVMVMRRDGFLNKNCQAEAVRTQK
jgi:hypothetical protein